MNHIPLKTVVEKTNFNNLQVDMIACDETEVQLQIIKSFDDDFFFDLGVGEAIKLRDALNVFIADREVETQKETSLPYEKEIDSILESIWREEWMSDEQYQAHIQGCLLSSGITKEQLSKDLQTGVDNGYSIEDQMKIIKLAME